MTLRTFSLITNVIFLNLWNKIEYNKGMKKISLLGAKSNLFMASCTTCTTESVIYSHNPCPFNWNVEITWHECWTGESFSIKIFCKENGFANTQQYLFVTFSCIPNGQDAWAAQHQKAQGLFLTKESCSAFQKYNCQM